MPIKEKRKNRLINSASPYLVQHAANPVDWYPWREEDFERAEKEDKPIFLSIGYSTCHWCHVMAHESFEDDEVADILNDGFVCIKVDREERPDVDNVYMRACQAITGSGGWPMSIFLTHERKPFFAGTYFPKYSRYGMTGFVELIKAVRYKWENDRPALLRSAGEITNFMKTPDSGANKGLTPEKAAEAFKKAYDPIYGGFGGAPKFPMPHSLLFLLSLNDNECAALAIHTLKCMYKGGIFDHIGGGFSRYSTDIKWLAPHFEKMLYDNALLIIAYLRAYRLTEEPLFRDVAERTITYILREMTDGEGGFLSAQDADSGGEEGGYYVFKKREIINLLGESDGSRLNEYYGISEEGNFEGKNIPNRLAAEYDGGMDKALDELRGKVYAYRKRRARLHTDDKILTGWNGLMIWALAYAYDVLGDERYVNAAKKAADFIETTLFDGDRLYASYRGSKRGGPGYIDDYAFFSLGLLALHNVTYKRRYVEKACRLTDYAIEHFFDRYEGGFYFYADDGEQLMLRPKEMHDGALPSGNSAVFYVLTILNALTGEYENVLEKQKEFMEKNMRHPLSHSFYLFAAQPQKKIVCVQGENAHELKEYDPDAIKLLLNNETNEYRSIYGKTTYYICENGACRPPVTDF